MKVLAANRQDRAAAAAETMGSRRSSELARSRPASFRPIQPNSARVDARQANVSFANPRSASARAPNERRSS